MIPKAILILIILVEVMLNYNCKKAEEPDPIENVSLISSFEATNYSILAGETTSLIWAVILADRIWIEPDIGDVQAVGVLDVSPNVTTTYTLRASYTYTHDNKLKTKGQSKSLSISVSPNPTSFKMQVNPGKIKEGEIATVSWLDTYDRNKVNHLQLVWLTYGPGGTPHCGTSGRTVTGTSYSEAFKMYCTSVSEVTSHFSLEVYNNDGTVLKLVDPSAMLIITK